MGRRAKPLPPLAELQQRYSYCPESGELRFREHRVAARVGELVGTPHQDGNTRYLRVKHKGRLLLVHRICWALANGADPVGVVDHINGDGLDNRASNLRDVSATVNNRNRNHKPVSATSVRGVYWHKSAQQYYAEISNKYIGSGDLLHCVALRKSAEQRLGYL